MCWPVSLGMEHWKHVQEMAQQYSRVILHPQPHHSCFGHLSGKGGRGKPGSCCLHFSEHCFCDFPWNCPLSCGTTSKGIENMEKFHQTKATAFERHFNPSATASRSHWNVCPIHCISTTSDYHFCWLTWISAGVTALMKINTFWYINVNIMILCLFIPLLHECCVFIAVDFTLMHI